MSKHRTYKYNNARITVIRPQNKEDSFIIKMYIIDGNTDKRSIHYVEHGAIFATIKVNLTGLHALQYAIEKELERYNYKQIDNLTH